MSRIPYHWRLPREREWFRFQVVGKEVDKVMACLNAGSMGDWTAKCHGGHKKSVVILLDSFEDFMLLRIGWGNRAGCSFRAEKQTYNWLKPMSLR